MAQWAKCLSCIHRTRVQSSRPHEKLHVVSAYRAHIPAARWMLETEELPEVPKPCSLADTVTHEKRLLLEHVEPSTWVVIWPPWDKCIYTNTQTHAHTGGAFWVFLFFVLFLKTRMYLWRKDRARHTFQSTGLSYGKQVRWVFRCHDHNLDVSRPQTTKRETYNFTALKIIGQNINMITTGPHDLTHMSMEGQKDTAELL